MKCAQLQYEGINVVNLVRLSSSTKLNVYT